MSETQRLVADLESSIDRYKTEYAELIAEAQGIKSKLEVYFLCPTRLPSRLLPASATAVSS